MRCLPPPGSLSADGCVLDEVAFKADGSCPSPTNKADCGTCKGIMTQEVCLGLCSEKCIWGNHTLIRGNLCSLRVVPPVIEDRTLFIVGISVVGVIALGAIIFSIRHLCKMRRKALEKARLQRMQSLKHRTGGKSGRGGKSEVVQQTGDKSSSNSRRGSRSGSGD